MFKPNLKKFSPISNPKTYVKESKSCSILLVLRSSFNVSIGLDEASCPSPWSYPYFLVSLPVLAVDIVGLGRTSSHPYLSVSLPAAYTRQNLLEKPETAENP